MKAKVQKFSGRLQYMGWFNLPWKLRAGNSETVINLWPFFDKFFISLDGKCADQKDRADSYILAVDKKSKYRFCYVPGKLVVLTGESSGAGMANVYAYLNDILVWLSGRMVKIEIEKGKQIKVVADKSEKVPGVYFVGDGNSCGVPTGAEKKICKMGQRDCCVFLCMGTGGFHCEKFNGPTARLLLDRLAKGTINASRIGNCAVIGRKE